MKRLKRKLSHKRPTKRSGRNAKGTILKLDFTQIKKISLKPNLKFKTPKLSVPSVPKVQLPKIQIPQISIPKVPTHSINPPKINLPKFNLSIRKAKKYSWNIARPGATKIDGKLIQKIVLAVVLVIILVARVIASVSSVQEVKASFPAERARVEITTPTVEIEHVPIDVHVQIQETASVQKDVRLQELSERSNRIARVRDFYARWNAPLGAHAETIVDAAERWGIDWRLVPAISIVESSGGRYCFRPYNAYGWGKAGYSSFDESIEAVTRGLSTGYRTSNPHAIGPKYNPVTPTEWSNKVAGLMSQL